MPRPKWPKELVRHVFDKGNGRCHHCSKQLRFEEAQGTTRQWEIDHYPVAYRDVEDQCCIV